MCVKSNQYYIYLLDTVPCGTPNKPTNGRVTLFNSQQGYIALYSCLDGFQLNGIPQRKCVSDTRQWTGKDPTCTSAGMNNFTTESFCAKHILRVNCLV